MDYIIKTSVDPCMLHNSHITSGISVWQRLFLLPMRFPSILINVPFCPFISPLISYVCIYMTWDLLYCKWNVTWDAWICVWQKTKTATVGICAVQSITNSYRTVFLACVNGSPLVFLHGKADCSRRVCQKKTDPTKPRTIGSNGLVMYVNRSYYSIWT